jgi:DNA-binding CsgD family transcriptional regulator
LQRREVLTKAHGHDAHSQNGSASRNGAAATSSQAFGQHRTSDMSVIVVGPELADPTRTDPAVEALLAAARGTGVFPTFVTTPDVGSVLEHYVRNRNELVVLALGSETALRNISAGPATPWERWAHLARDFGRVGATVLAVGVGASVAAIAMCVREGAVGVLDLGEFAEQLEKMSVNLASRRLAAESGGREARGSARGGLPNPYNRLVDLTASEHRVLYQMMRGVSASEIAEELVVSLATVRSHIRSILRKLQVSSQLAAVALANGVRPDVIEAV